jgi:hypothetical protein
MLRDCSTLAKKIEVRNAIDGNAKESDDKEQAAAMRNLVALSSELKTYLLFAETAAKIFENRKFGDIKSETDWNQSDIPSTVEALARIRQAMEISSSIAYKNIGQLHAK